ncbi:hypothetical protein NKF26_12100 [Haladaptatus sp. AB618]|uniref:hypothetical protein n=1 Tax=Haladaptatus sp. AB618 TaxID=2934173 RepID=UPI00209C1690|nr:hypothetical protein [Haladaptatus sp. AB618]MCO8254545.1 hypothetical protein [Haladaptatus sp. AB618]
MGDGLVELASQIKEAGGPRKWVFGRITEFVIGAAVGTTVGVADLLNSSIDSVTSALDYTGTSATDAFDTVGQTLLTLNAQAFNVVSDTAKLVGPFGPLVLVFVAVVLAALIWRAGRAFMADVPILSAIQTFMDGK